MQRNKGPEGEGGVLVGVGGAACVGGAADVGGAATCPRKYAWAAQRACPCKANER